MNREAHVRFSEGLGVRFPRATRPTRLKCTITLSLSLNYEPLCLSSGTAYDIHALVYPNFRFNGGKLPNVC